MTAAELEKLLAWWKAKPFRWSTTAQLAIGYALARAAGRSPVNKKLIAECERGLAALRAEMEGARA